MQEQDEAFQIRNAVGQKPMQLGVVHLPVDVNQTVSEASYVHELVGELGGENAGLSQEAEHVPVVLRRAKGVLADQMVAKVDRSLDRDDEVVLGRRDLVGIGEKPGLWDRTEFLQPQPTCGWRRPQAVSAGCLASCPPSPAFYPSASVPVPRCGIGAPIVVPTPAARPIVIPAGWPLYALTLLHLGMRGMQLGPSLPAFLTPEVLQVLGEVFNLKPIRTPEKDLRRSWAQPGAHLAAVPPGLCPKGGRVAGGTGAVHLGGETLWVRGGSDEARVHRGV